MVILATRGSQSGRKIVPFLRLKGKRGVGSSILGGGPKIPPFLIHRTDDLLARSVFLFVMSSGNNKQTSRTRKNIKRLYICLCLFLFVLSLSASRRVLTWIKKWLRWRRLAKLEATTRSPWGPPGVPQGGPQKGAPPGRSKNGDFWAKFFTNPE